MAGQVGRCRGDEWGKRTGTKVHGWLQYARRGVKLNARARSSSRYGADHGGWGTTTISVVRPDKKTEQDTLVRLLQVIQVRTNVKAMFSVCASHRLHHRRAAYSPKAVIYVCH